jgi:hypothetical protein
MWMRTIVRVIRFVAIVLALVAGGALLVVYVVSQRKLSATYDVPASAVEVRTDDASIARGGHLVRAVGTCTLCHGEDLGGGVYADMGLMGRIVGPNLTPGRGGVGAQFTVTDWVRAIRYGVRRDGTSLVVMPSEVYTFFSDADLGSIIGYLEQVPPVDRELPPTRFGPLGRVLLAAGRLNLLVAPKTHHPGSATGAPPEPTAAYGKYLADVSGCHGCHGFGLSGGRVAGPPDLPLAANLTPAGLADWTDRDFLRAMREGRLPDGRALDEFMPWRSFAAMTDDELRALWLYLRSVPPRATGNK